MKRILIVFLLFTSLATAAYTPPAYASIYLAGGSATIDPADFTVATQLTGFAANGPASNATADYANNKITITTAGTYAINCGISFAGSANSTFVVKVYYDGSPAAGIQLTRKLGTGGDVGRGACNGLLTCAAAKDITIYAVGDGAADTMSIKDIILTVIRVGP